MEVCKPANLCRPSHLCLPHGALPLGLVPQHFVNFSLTNIIFCTTFQGMKYVTFDNHADASLESKYSCVGLSMFGMEV